TTRSTRLRSHPSYLLSPLLCSSPRPTSLLPLFPLHALLPISAVPAAGRLRPGEQSGPAGLSHRGAGRDRRSIQIHRRREAAGSRSEEHTSELQSLTNLVCRLLLSKNKTQTTTQHPSFSHTHST